MGLLDKLRHKKNRSTSGTSSPTSPSSPNFSNPSSPTQRNQDGDVTPTSSPSRVRASLDERLDRSGQSIGRRSMDGTRPIVPVPAAFKPRSNVNLPSPSSGRSSQNIPPVPVVDRAAHSSPFQDETDRPNLPTTTSNVNNPIPDTYESSANKRLPSLPHISAGPPLDYELPPGAAPPLPHVTSVDRTPILEDQTHRPQPVISESQPQQTGLQGKFPHVLASRSSAVSADSRYSDNEADIPARSTSLHPERAQDLTNSNTTTTTTNNTTTTTTNNDTLARYDAFRSVIDPDLTPEDFITQYLHRTHLQTQQKAVVPNEEFGAFTTPQLERERESMVRRIASEADQRMRGERGLNAFGVDVFNRSGLGEKVGLGSTVDVHTKWLAPVVQEHIRPIEVHEYCTIIYQEVHKYDIYPKIQPIFDPEPIILEPRHRIFSPFDNQWHEVIGDAAAISILGEDAFLNGRKTVREVRKSVLPGFEKENGEIEAGGVGRGLGRVREREGLLGGQWGPWKDVGRGRVFEGMKSPVPRVLQGFEERRENRISRSEIGLAV